MCVNIINVHVDTCILVHITPVGQTHTNTEPLYIFMVDALPLMRLILPAMSIIGLEDLFYVVFSLMDKCIAHQEIMS